MAVVFQLEDGDAGTSDFADSKKNNIVSTAGENTPPKHFGVGAYEGKSSQAFVGSKATTPTAYQVKKQISFLKVETAAQSNTAAGTQTGTPSSIYTKDGVDFTLTTKKHTHIGASSALSAELANPRIVAELGTGWEIADWYDFTSFTEDDFKGFLRILTPVLGVGIATNCSTLLEGVGVGVAPSGRKWLGQNFGWVLFAGDGSLLTSKYMGGANVAGQTTVRKNYLWTFWNNAAAIPLADHPQQYLNRFVMLSLGEGGTLSYICKRTGSSLPNTKGGCF